MRREGWQIAVMTIGFMLFLGLLAVVVVNASAGFLQRQALNNIADGAALAAADGLSQTAFYRTGDVTLSSREARQLVSAYVAQTRSGARATRVTVDGDQVNVRLERSVSLALSPPGWSSRATIVSEATSQLMLSE